ncbi:MAG: IPTL-CTERM sorting domain-containing protein [candidate division Zixibacteria bacterium]
MALRKSLLVLAILLALPTMVFAVEHFISIPGLSFSPADLTIAEGDIVTWTNDHTINHTSTSDDGGVEWDSGVIPPGESFSYTFTSTGTYPYLCTIHPSMTGSITVEPTDNVPTLSEWGMILLGLFLVLGGTIGVVRRHKLALEA